MKVALKVTFSRPLLVKDDPELPQERAKPVPLGCISIITIRIEAKTTCKIRKILGIFGYYTLKLIRLKLFSQPVNCRSYYRE